MASGFGIECDVQLSSDGEAMVFHDFGLDRLTAQTGHVNAWTAVDLSALTLGGGRDRIPTLPAFLDRIAGRVPLIIEVKSRFDGDERLAARVAAICAGRPHPIALKSFDPAAVAALRRLAPERPRGIVAQCEYIGGEWDALPGPRRREMANLLHWPETRPDFLSWRVGDLPAAAPFLARRLAGVPVMAWTVRDQATAAAARPHADQIVFEGFVPA